MRTWVTCGGKGHIGEHGLVALSSPFLGGISDHARAKKRFLVAYTLLCVLATAFLALVDKGMVMTGFVLVVLANVGMEGGIVFYNSFLNDIADNEHQGRVSAWGYATGYLGSIVSLAVALLFVRTNHITFVWPMVTVFFAVFSLRRSPSFPQTRERARGWQRPRGMVSPRRGVS
jgi:UMF1 family MFS transporter